ncbi:TetR-like C-terminal domain-containing protein [Ancylobacter dichloromethanicus]
MERQARPVAGNLRSPAARSVGHGYRLAGRRSRGPAAPAVPFLGATPAGQAFTAILVEAQHDPAALQALRAFLAERTYPLAEPFDRAARRGELASDFDLATTLDLVSGYVWARLLTRRLDDDDPALPAAARTIARGSLGAERTGKSSPVRSGAIRLAISDARPRRNAARQRGERTRGVPARVSRANARRATPAAAPYLHPA